MSHVELSAEVVTYNLSVLRIISENGRFYKYDTPPPVLSVLSIAPNSNELLFVQDNDYFIFASSYIAGKFHRQ